MVAVIRRWKSRAVYPDIEEWAVRLTARRDLFKRKKDMEEKELEEAARRMIEWEAEEASGDESVDSME